MFIMSTEKEYESDRLNSTTNNELKPSCLNKQCGGWKCMPQFTKKIRALIHSKYTNKIDMLVWFIAELL